MTRDANIAANESKLITLNHNQRISLPLQHVFSFLNRSDLLQTNLVSKSWHIASAKKIWSTFKFVREREFERIFHLLSRNNTTTKYGDFITSLELIHSDREFSINSNHIFLITMLCPNLESISITCHHTRTPIINNIKSQRLPPPLLARQHHINPLPQQQAQLHAPLPPIQQPINQLQPPPPPPPSPNLPLAHFAHNCPKLKSIRLVSYKPKTDDSVYEMAKYLTTGSLESIQLINCTTIQSSTLCKLAMTNPQLKSIEIMGTTPINDSSLATLADRCGNQLEYLSIGNAYQLTDKSMRYIPARCKKIKEICIFNNNIERISENTLTLVITHCPTLQVLSISDSRGLGSMFFEAIIRRVNNEIMKIKEQAIEHNGGLRLLCLGGVKREIIHSIFTRELMDASANRHDTDQNTQEEEENIDDLDMSDQISHLMNNRATKFMPKSIIIRGDTIWWQRRKITTQ